MMKYTCVCLTVLILVGCDDAATESATEEDVLGDGSSDVGQDTQEDVAEDDASTGDASDDQVPVDLANDAEDQSSGPECVVVDLTEVEWVAPAADKLHDSLELAPWRTFETAEEFEDALGSPPPASINFPEEWAFLYSGQTGFGTNLGVERLEYCPEQIHLETLLIYGVLDCDYLDLSGWDSYVLVKFPALDFPVDESGWSIREDMVIHSCADDGSAPGDPCTIETQCQPGHICAGLTQEWTGVCVPTENSATFTNSIATPIPDGELAGVESENTVVGLPGTAVDVVVTTVIDHPMPTDLTISLIGPLGTEVIIKQKEERNPNINRGVYGFAGETANGIWKLKIVDDATGNRGEVDRWSLTLTSREP